MSDSLNKKQIQDLFNFTLPHSIKMDDNCYFSNALEARQPYLDHRIVEFGVSLPENFLIRKNFYEGGELKKSEDLKYYSSGEIFSSETFMPASKTVIDNLKSQLWSVESMLKMEKVRNNISDALDAEYSFTARSQEFGDFQEGIRAAVIDKDRTPLWKNKNLSEVSDEDLKPFFQTIHR